MNKCDMDEVKALAIQKFLELASEPDEWVPASTSSFIMTLYPELVRGKYTISDYGSGSYSLSIGGESLWPELPPRPELKYKKDKTLTVASQKAVEKWRVECANTPFHKAVSALFKHYREKQCEKDRDRMLKDMEESCQKIRSALVDPLKPTPPEHGRLRYTEPLAYQHRPWWKFWSET